jgi:manganese/zinc/iron transport system ATP- binding protein
MTTSKNDKALSVENLSVHYGSTPALWDVSFEMPSGKIIGIVGPNGAGKSTLLKAVLQLIPLSSGAVRFFDKELKQARQLVAYVPQKESVDWDFPITVQELVLMGRYGHIKVMQRPRACDIEAADELIEKVGLTKERNRQINELSGGQQQRAFFARALMQDASIYFMDEPFKGIDHTTEKVLLDLLGNMKNSGKSVFIVHHDLDTVRAHFDYAILLNMHLIDAGPIDEVFTKENLRRAYGQQYNLLDEALRLSFAKLKGK